MSQAQVSARFYPFVPSYVTNTESSPLSSIVYRSRAATTFSYPELQDLAAAAQSRNRRESISGLMVYDNAQFFQWLEGPADSIARVMQSIRNDPRHTDMEILNARPIDRRVFSGWDMKLATRSPQGGLWRRDVIYPRLEILAGLQGQLDAVPELLQKLAPQDQGPPAAKQQTTALLHNIIKNAVIPELLSRRGNLPPAPKPLILDPRVLELAELLLASDASAALDLIHEQLSEGESPVALYGTLLEPAARRLGDLWSDDVVSELDVTIGLTHLQRAARLLGAESLPPLLSGAPAPAVLVVPQPGELHGLGAALDSEAMWRRGWSPQAEFPSDDEALRKILTADWFDVLDLTLSVALRREHWLPRMAQTINLARRASRNPALIVMVGGRVFSEQSDAAAGIEADAGSRTASDVTQEIIRTLEAAGTRVVVPVRSRATG